MSQELPKLRPLQLQWVQWQGQEALSLQDSLRLSQGYVVVPKPVVPLLGLLDGTRDMDALRSGFLHHTGIQLHLSQVESFVQSLDEGLLLDNRRFRDAVDAALTNYRSASHRTPALAGASYPAEGPELLEVFDGYCRKARADGRANGKTAPGQVVGLISPHIDYHRGWLTYAESWQPAAEAVEAADLVIMLGTDHSGRPGTLTLTRQDYATPWGPLPTDTGLVDQLAEIIGEDKAFAEEFHHIGEHSVELASVWLHYFAGRKPKRLLPILCGSDENLADTGEQDTTTLQEALAYLSKVATQQKTLVIAAGDLSHMGPAFGDSLALDVAAKARIRATDEAWLEVACTGNSESLAGYLRREGDPTRICGASPIRYMLAILQEVKGQVVAYDQCPADEQFGSLVSIAGVVYRE